MFRHSIFLFLLLPFLSSAQHTFSIVAVDSTTFQIGSAGATCGDSIVWPGSKGAYVISEVLPGVGGIHAQALLNTRNKQEASQKMSANYSPQQIIDHMIANDVNGTPEVRQYGVVDLNGGSPRSAAFTGDSCMDYKNHIVGPYYSIQGNILLGQSILDSMEARFLRTKGCLADRLMAAMQGANLPGADTRCAPEYVSSLSAFIRVAQPDDPKTDLWLDINVAGTGFAVEPIDVLQTRYNNWKTQNPDACLIFGEDEEDKDWVRIGQNENGLLIHVMNSEMEQIELFDIQGKRLYSEKIGSEPYLSMDLSSQSSGTFIIRLLDEKGSSRIRKIIF